MEPVSGAADGADRLWIVDGTLVPVRDRNVGSSSRNYRFSANVQVIVDADTHLVIAAARPVPGTTADALAGELVTCYLFSLRLSCSGKAVHRVFTSCGQESFFEGHVHALRTLGGVPRSKIRYDNLTSAVAQVLGLNRARAETDRWIAFPKHFVHAPVGSLSLPTASTTSMAA